MPKIKTHIDPGEYGYWVVERKWMGADYRYWHSQYIEFKRVVWC